MDVHTNIPLKNYLTMKLGGSARFITTVSTEDELREACKNAKSQNIPFFILGGGSNVIAKDTGFDGLIILNRIMGFETVSEDPGAATFRIGAGENWDNIVKRTVEMGLSGIEAMSAIPGTIGAAPVQNVGAYGQEISEVLVHLEAYDSAQDTFVTLQNAECGFSYRQSIFREQEFGRYVITRVTIILQKTAPQPPFYAALQNYLDSNGITLFTPSVIRDAVTAIRAEKLPDPDIRPNTGSFFKNAIIEEWQLNDLRKEWPQIPSYDLGDKKYKIPTGWLIEQVGLRGAVLNGMKVHDKNALVLINESASSYNDLAAARQEIIGRVRDTFRISIEQEPIEI